MSEALSTRNLSKGKRSKGLLGASSDLIMEWRCFLPMPARGSPVWEALANELPFDQNDLRGPLCETREDEYMVIQGAPDLGIKRRALKGLEVKVRESGPDESGIETWRKYHGVPQQLQERIPTGFLQVGGPHCIRVSKQRSQRPTYSPAMAWAEVAHLAISRSAGEDQQTGHSSQMWLSIAIEGPYRQALEELGCNVERSIKTCADVGDFIIGGYPTWLLSGRLFQKDENGKVKQDRAGEAGLPDRAVV